MNFLKALVLILCLTVSKSSFALENLVYSWRGYPNQLAEGQQAIRELKEYGKAITILSPQAYHVRASGFVYGGLNPEMVKVVREHKIALMPLVGNSNFDREKTHLFLEDEAAMDKAITALVSLCKKQKLYGLQIDFEGMSYKDRDAYTRFFQKLAARLHQAGFKASIAIIPMLTDSLDSAYLQGRYRGWAGVYDNKALGESADFVTLMAYDQHGDATPPGPSASYTWDEAIIRYALKYIPAEKLSLGIPWHSGHWAMSKNLRTQPATLRYSKVQDLIKEHALELQWDPAAKVHFARYENLFLDEYLYVEDSRSYREKLALVKRYGLRGVSNWCLGEEDPRVWSLFQDS